MNAIAADLVPRPGGSTRDTGEGSEPRPVGGGRRSGSATSRRPSSGIDSEHRRKSGTDSGSVVPELRRSAPSPWRWIAGGLALFFGVMTLISGANVLFGGAAARAEAGDIVPFVLIFNWVAGFAYVVAGGATFAQRRWALWLARALAGSTLVVFAAFGVHVFTGGAFETRTVIAMTVRSVFWVAQSLALATILRAGGGR